MLHDRPSNPITFRFSHVLRHPRPRLPAAASIIFDVCRTIRAFCNAKMLPVLPCCKDDLNVFNKIRTLFSPFLSADPLLSTLSKLFSTKQGGRGTSVPLAGK